MLHPGVTNADKVVVNICNAISKKQYGTRVQQSIDFN